MMIKKARSTDLTKNEIRQKNKCIFFVERILFLEGESTYEE